MGRTVRTQVALYLDDDRVEALRRLAEKSGRTQQDLLREALDTLLVQHKMLPAPKRRK
ncbi:MAG: ribbon-helix-helix protein, CopG family [Gammaproteobacteria bacterium]|nr:ribbon-helix-helix protein, CopG family [Gammaproteobacteria bacterium]